MMKLHAVSAQTPLTLILARTFVPLLMDPLSTPCTECPYLKIPVATC